jgi:Ni/Fe-hydrogenase subunit HybB-like protein
MTFLRFIRAGLGAMFQGNKFYWSWLGLLLALFVTGLVFYSQQLQQGVIITGMSDQVSWGFYIANFTFMLGIASSIILLLIPAYLFGRKDVKQVVLIGQAMAVSAVLTAMLLVIVDLGRPDRMWHLLPFIGKFNLPQSMLAWDVVSLNGFLLLNLLIPFYLLFSQYQGKPAVLKYYFPFIVLTIVWAIFMTTIEAMLFATNSGRPLWHTPLLGPRLLASAFVIGPAVFIITLLLLRRFWQYPVKQTVIDILSSIMLYALYITLFISALELLVDFYNETTDAGSLRYLFLGLRGYASLTPWIWISLLLNIIAVLLLSFRQLRQNIEILIIACCMSFVGIWIEKGMGFVVGGFIPTPIGEIYEYTPTFAEIMITLGCWSIGALVFTLLARASIILDAKTKSSAAQQ